MRTIVHVYKSCENTHIMVNEHLETDSRENIHIIMNLHDKIDSTTMSLYIMRGVGYTADVRHNRAQSGGLSGRRTML